MMSRAVRTMWPPHSFDHYEYRDPTSLRTLPARDPFVPSTAARRPLSAATPPRDRRPGPEPHGTAIRSGTRPDAAPWLSLRLPPGLWALLLRRTPGGEGRASSTGADRPRGGLGESFRRDL